MGAQDDGPQPRPPEIEDLVDICRALNAVSARYILVGGFAVNLHGYTRGTMDIDLLIDPSPENVRKVKSALSVLPDNAAANVEEEDVRTHSVVRVADEVVVDLLAKACGVDVDEALGHVLYRTIDGVSIPYPDLATLIATKDTIRPKDHQDVAFLKMKLSEGS
ncbi:MAG: hypothetical protein HY553_16395 [Elusimicrobia bacterium]|nr:hypothetical protein [Elusimicrobiota bacterium]